MEKEVGNNERKRWKNLSLIVLAMLLIGVSRTNHNSSIFSYPSFKHTNSFWKLFEIHIFSLETSYVPNVCIFFTKRKWLNILFELFSWEKER